MRKTIFALLTVLALASFVADKPKKVIFFGDSITQAGVKPNGYITRIGELLTGKNLGSKYELIGAGIGGNKVYDLYLRLESDVLEKKPDAVFIYVGVNDVWHKTTSGTGTDPDKFVRFYQALIDKIKASGAKVVLCTPAVIGEKNDFSNPQDGDMNHYSNLIRKLAEKNSLPLVDLRKAFLAYDLANNPSNKDSGVLTTDRVHLNDLGNNTVAELMLAELLKL
ncbi:SGNH/GDSL hydrolase family protein [Flectobacillus roseus]|uniref:SGNH/GDSL hydrolase family protein n=1 Tax=Flectobacillus roseus TaxID=502259 RepID=A0ABT6Y3F9_9BACT|nr:SGNH/GDSL hydrolase family protein [Flectobacillus roseus]MDI9858090.1 SGNH/GDSL hydrolase family protein [Flectobacillus roseus]MDI9867983.1 SGNH/GDSL hydrolase family protein [Flectobacillus roseus]